MSLAIEVLGQSLLLLPERAVYWEQRSTLLVGDVHLGKEATFRAAGLPVPGNVSAADLDRLGRLVDLCGAERLVILGDLYHARAGMNEGTRSRLVGWRSSRLSLELVLVRGNHDRSAGRSPAEAMITEIDGVLFEAPFAFSHDVPDQAPGYVISGHVHPGIDLIGRGRDRVRLPCFVIGEERMLLPAFSLFTGLARVTQRAGDRVAAIVDDEVMMVR
jgi:uncharacterized protein